MPHTRVRAVLLLGVTVKCDLSDPEKQGRGNAVQPDFPAPSVTRPLMPEGDT